MGLVKTEKQDNNTILLEITYGGKEAPFGGIDSSMPPPYIDPTCFIASSGFLIINGVLVAVGFQNIGVVLDGWGANIYLGSGSFFANGQYNNFAIGYTEATSVGPPSSVTITYNIWVWASGGTGHFAVTATLPVTQYATTLPATPALATLNCSGGTALGTGNVALTVGGVLLNIAIGVGNTPGTLATNIAAAVNGAAGYPCTAVVDSTGVNVILTTTATGSAANSTTLTCVTTSSGGVPSATVVSPFSGANNSINENFGIPIAPLSWVTIGETLYLGGAGSMILQYSNQNGVINFSVLTQYLGAVYLAKFNGQLIAAGVVPGPGQFIQFAEMVVAWCAPEGQYGIWNPTDINGNVTGAGFEQVGDIADYITGMFITPGAAAVLRTQGIDYLTSLQNGTAPFDFQHISNSKRGEGAQDSRLVTQYDQTGFFIGNSDVYIYEGNLAPVGAKIKNILLTDILSGPIINRNSNSGAVNFNGNLNVFAFFIIDYTIYAFCLNNKTWMQINTTQLQTAPNFLAMEFFAASALAANNPQFNNQFNATLVTQNKEGVFPFGNFPQFWSLTPFVQDNTLPQAAASFILFPPEEISFGRDITIDGLFIAIAGSPGQVINFSLIGTAPDDGAVSTLTSEFVLPATALPNVFVNYQISWDQDVTTLQNPQLRIDVPVNTSGTPSALAFSKIAEFGSFDPSQRPI